MKLLRENAAKGYWIANVDVRNADGNKVWPRCPIFCAKFGDRYVTRGGKPCLNSPVMRRQANADADLIVIECYDRPQP